MPLEATRGNTRTRLVDAINLVVHNLDLLYGLSTAVLRAQHELLTAGYRHLRRTGRACYLVCLHGQKQGLLRAHALPSLLFHG